MGKSVRPKRLAHLPEAAFQRLHQAILSGELKEGERVRETRLARDWDIGITPMREAVRRMAALGYLVLRPNYAPLVRKLSEDDIRQIYALRQLLECDALKTGWAEVRRQDLEPIRRFVAKIEAITNRRRRIETQLELDGMVHRLWLGPCHNPWLLSALERLLIYRPNITNLITLHPEYGEQAFEEHKRILAALKRGNFRQTRDLLALHIRNSGEVLAALTRGQAAAS